MSLGWHKNPVTRQTNIGTRKHRLLQRNVYRVWTRKLVLGHCHYHKVYTQEN